MQTVVWFGLVLAAVSAARKVVISKPGQRAIFDCPSSEYKGSVRWYQGELEILRKMKKSDLVHKGMAKVGERAKLKNLNLPTLEISGVKEEDAGEFKCNMDGKIQEYLLFVVSVSATPSADLNLNDTASLRCQVRGLTPVPSVEWRKPDGLIHKGSELHLKPVALTDAGTWKCLFDHDRMTYNESLEIRVTEPATTARLPASSLKPKDISDVPCDNGETNPPHISLGLMWWMWIIIGVGCLVVVLLIVVIICSYRRIKRKRRKQAKIKPLMPRQCCQCKRPTAAERPQQRRRREKPPPVLLQHHLME